MKTAMRAIALMPVWAITLLVKPFFPATHPWKNRRMTLRSWARYGTPTSVSFGIGFWILGLSFAVALWCLQTHKVWTALALTVVMNCFVFWFLNKLDSHGI